MRWFDTPSWKWHDLTRKPFRPIESTLSDDEKEDMSDESKDDGPVPPDYHFPDLDKHIRGCIEEYGAVFPKLNFSSPKVSEDKLLSKAGVKRQIIYIGRVVATPVFCPPQVHIPRRRVYATKML